MHGMIMGLEAFSADRVKDTGQITAVRSPGVEDSYLQIFCNPQKRNRNRHGSS